MDTELTFDEVLAKAEHYKAVGQTRVYLYADGALPLDRVTRIEAGRSYRLNVPVDVRLTAEVDGLEISNSYELESRDASGKGTHLIDTDRLHHLAEGLPVGVAAQLVALLRDKVMPSVAERTREIYEAYAKQLASQNALEQACWSVSTRLADRAGKGAASEIKRN